jgi:ferritin-like metal-binding protein YciE
LSDLVIQKLRPVDDTEQRLVDALLGLSNATSTPDLKQEFDVHLEQTSA